MDAKRRLIASGFVLAVALFAGAANLAYSQALEPAQGGPLTGPPVTPQRPGTFEPHDPYRQLVPGLLVRTRYVTKADGRDVELWDLMAGPGKTSEKTRLPGAAIVDVRSGMGVLQAAGKARELRIGSMTALEDGAEFTVANRDQDSPLILRVTLIRRRH